MKTFFKELKSGNIVTELTTFSPADDQATYEKLTANTVDAAQEKHVPVVSKDGNTVTVAVGSVPHPMEEAHYITAIYIETSKGGQFANLKPGEKPEATFTLNDGEEFVAAYEYCNLHGLWKN
ncbi:superoxide reductase [Lachnospiraceae bacterium PF1-21]|uniref:Desulfoferrodoxin family protein n=1 Tax=Ohessyouella blattaphilus TaxID=2949333 RepID=A0ABT1EGW2_9FIRM|nr:desulfoferrodoxin family protein [Ohessyouella blattaphilus]MCP1109957.1 desulfoferrodoxin family protein [Ohessyouella blattaphilus]MCR8563351.1 desulfoferrodoxin [Ohessyouella blattaphilus]